MSCKILFTGQESEAEYKRKLEEFEKKNAEGPMRNQTFVSSHGPLQPGKSNG